MWKLSLVQISKTYVPNFLSWWGQGRGPKTTTLYGYISHFIWVWAKILISTSSHFLLWGVIQFYKLHIFPIIILLNLHHSHRSLKFSTQISPPNLLSFFAGCLLMFGFFIPVATRGLLKPTTAVVGALSYAFIFVPLVSGLLDPRPIQNYLLLFLM